MTYIQKFWDVEEKEIKLTNGCCKRNAGSYNRIIEHLYLGRVARESSVQEILKLIPK